MASKKHSEIKVIVIIYFCFFRNLFWRECRLQRGWHWCCHNHWNRSQRYTTSH